VAKYQGFFVWKTNGDEGNRTPVRKPDPKDFSHHSQLSGIPSP